MIKYEIKENFKTRYTMSCTINIAITIKQKHTQKSLDLLNCYSKPGNFFSPLCLQNTDETQVIDFYHQQTPGKSSL